MKILLKYLNPALALFVLILCVWAASTMDNGKVNVFGLVDGGFGTYFFAKGVFCAATLFLAGRSLLARMETHPESFVAYSIQDLLLVAVILSALVGGFWGIHSRHAGGAKAGGESVSETILSPKGVVMQPLTRVGAAEHLSVSTQISNASGKFWRTLGVRAEVFIGGVYSGTLVARDTGIAPNHKRNLLLKSDDLLTREIHDSVTFQVEVWGERCRVCE